MTDSVEQTDVMSFKEFSALCEKSGAKGQIHTATHWKVIGRRRVNYYPTASPRSKYHVEGSSDTAKFGGASQAIHVAMAMEEDTTLGSRPLTEEELCRRDRRDLHRKSADEYGYTDDVHDAVEHREDATVNDGSQQLTPSELLDRDMEALSEAAHGYDAWSKNTPSSLQHQHGGDHYKRLVIQPAEYNHKNGFKFCAAEAIKYLSRYGFKNGQEDIRKAIHFCQMILDFEYGIPTKVLYGDEALSEAVCGDADSEQGVEEGALHQETEPG